MSFAVQQTFDELGTPLRDVTFVVVDLETTGGSPAAGSSITEIGAVKVRHGEVLGEFQTLVKPSDEIPAFIAVLTGITNAMVADAPRIESALPAFLEFARGCVLVAHNAPFDVGFLRHYSEAMGIAWPRFEVLDTAKLARRVVTRDDAPNCKLSSLARLFRSSTTPNHRALSDARATVDVLHGLMERLGNLGVHTLEELQTFSSRVSPGQRRKRHLAEQLPHRPGVYLFRDAQRRVLYVGTSKDLRNRVRTYFTASETRSRMGEMVGLAESVEGIVCATAARGRGARAAADRRAQAALQPPFEVPRAGHLGQAHRRGLAAAVDGQAGARRRRRLPRPVPLPQGTPRPRWRRCTRASRSGSAATGCPSSPQSHARARWPRWAAACPRATARSRLTTTRSPSRRCVSRSTPAPPE